MDTNNDIGITIIDGRTNDKKLVLYEEILESDIKDSLVINERTNEAEKITRYGSNKTYDE
jgi:hypothetical protein